MAERFAVELLDAIRPLVLSLDIGSTGTRGGLFDAGGRPIAKSRVRVEHSFKVNASGRSEIGADQLVREVVSAIDGITAPLKRGEVAAVCLDTFASSLVGVDEGAAITPGYSYADARCADDVLALRSEIDEEALQQRTGTRLHTSYLPARLRWLARTQPDTFDLVDTWMTVGQYVWWRILGVRGAAMSDAAWTGMLNRHEGDWDSEVLAAVGLTAGHVPPIRTEPFTRVAPRVAQRWPALEDAKWFPAIPDGLASTFAAGIADPATITLSASTSGAVRVLTANSPRHLPAGLWCYRVDSDRSLVGGALNDVGRAASWLDRLLPGLHSPSLFEGPPTDAMPTVLPFLTGERSTGWHGEAHAVAAGLTEVTGPRELYRGVMEGVAMSYRRVVDEVREVLPEIDGIVATGGLSGSMPAWVRMLADAIGLPVTPLQMKRSTLRGNAVYALETIAPGIERAAPEYGEEILPDEASEAIYRERYAQFLRLYDQLYERAER